MLGASNLILIARRRCSGQEHFYECARTAMADSFLYRPLPRTLENFLSLKGSRMSGTCQHHGGARRRWGGASSGGGHRGMISTVSVIHPCHGSPLTGNGLFG